MKKCPTPRCTPRSGFTLLELAVTVIIIAVLAMVALPMYKHAVLKSRFSTVMPAAKAVADAQEVYYLGNNQYALGKEKLDVAPVQAENTQVSLSTADEEDKYIYVVAKRSDIPDARYIMYQKNSPQFAGNIHCEAKADNEEALWLCEKGLHGTELTGEGNSSIQGNDYKTFLLAGTRGTGDYFAKACSGSAEKTCSCGGPVTGSCNEETGNWVYENDCPTPDPDDSEDCPTGYVGSRTRHAECENGVYVNKWTEDCELACPENAICDGNGTVTGCESGYYLEEETCKQEIACDESAKTIRTSCAEDCGEEIKQGSCNKKTGQWENYTVTQECPVKPPLTKACSELGKGWTSGTAQGTTQCNGGSWTEPEWNEEPCQKSCDSAQQTLRTACAENCGEQVQQGTCNTKTGVWSYTVTQVCPTKPSASANCGSNYANSTSKKTRSLTCRGSSWTTGSWNYSACGGYTGTVTEKGRDLIVSVTSSEECRYIAASQHIGCDEYTTSTDYTTFTYDSRTQTCTFCPSCCSF